MSGLRIAGVVGQTIVDGPGLRMTVYTQGCPHHCPGCHNPATHDFKGGYNCDIERILKVLDQNPLLSGVTLSGGEPFAQAQQLLPLAYAIKERGKHLMAYSGYTWEELLDQAAFQPAILELLELLDILVDGRFLLEQRDLSLRFRGSRNQRILNVPSSLLCGQAILHSLQEDPHEVYAGHAMVAHGIGRF